MGDDLRGRVDALLSRDTNWNAISQLVKTDATNYERFVSALRNHVKPASPLRRPDRWCHKQWMEFCDFLGLEWYDIPGLYKKQEASIIQVETALEFTLEELRSNIGQMVDYNRKSIIGLHKARDLQQSLEQQLQHNVEGTLTMEEAEQMRRDHYEWETCLKEVEQEHHYQELAVKESRMLESALCYMERGSRLMLQHARNARNHMQKTVGAYDMINRWQLVGEDFIEAFVAGSEYRMRLREELEESITQCERIGSVICR